MNVIAAVVFAGRTCSGSRSSGRTARRSRSPAPVLMVLVGVLDQEQAIEALDWATLGLLAA